MRRFIAAAEVIVGLLLVLAAALICVGFFDQSRFRFFVPLGFGVLLIALARRFGTLVSVLGSIMAGLIFAWFLYKPIGSIRVENSTARGNLGWMILAAVAVSNLLFLPTSNIERKR